MKISAAKLLLIGAIAVATTGCNGSGQRAYSTSSKTIMDNKGNSFYPKEGTLVEFPSGDCIQFFDLRNGTLVKICGNYTIINDRR